MWAFRCLGEESPMRYMGLLRVVLGALLGLAVGVVMLAILAACLFCGRAAFYTLVHPSMRIDVWAGGLKSVVFELPLVTFGLPFLDAWICPGVLTGAVAHRLRALRFQMLAGAACGLFFCIIVWRTYNLIDPVSIVGFILLESCIAVSVAWIDERILRWLEGVNGGSIGEGAME